MLFLRKNVKIIFFESWCRVQNLSLTGKILYFFVDRYPIYSIIQNHSALASTSKILQVLIFGKHYMMNEFIISSIKNIIVIFGSSLQQSLLLSSRTLTDCSCHMLKIYTYIVHMVHIVLDFQCLAPLLVIFIFPGEFILQIYQTSNLLLHLECLNIRYLIKLL